MSNLRNARILLWSLVAIVVAGLGLLLLSSRDEPVPNSVNTVSASFGGPFTLVGANGEPFSSSRLSGRPYAIFFGFTHCPDVCPVTLSRLVRLRRELGEGEDSFDIVFVSVDPERDTPVEIAKYVTLFDDPVIGLTGSPAQIEQVKKQFGIYSRKVPSHHGGPGYGVEHTSTVLLFDKRGKLAATIAQEEGDAPARAKLEGVIA